MALFGAFGSFFFFFRLAVHRNKDGGAGQSSVSLSSARLARIDLRFLPFLSPSSPSALPSAAASLFFFLFFGVGALRHTHTPQALVNHNTFCT